MKKSKKTILKWICGGITALLIILAAGGWWMFGIFITAANSIEKLEDGLYSMEYYGDYGFDDFLSQGGAASDSSLADYLIGYLSHGFYKIESDVQTGEFGCSTISVADENGTTFFGRNYDWEECQTMIVHTRPKNSYESVSTCCLDFLGFNEEYTPDGSMIERMQTLAAVYVPLDGMNEKGLVVADLMAGDKEESHQQTDKPDLTTTTAIRLLLDRAWAPGSPTFALILFPRIPVLPMKWMSGICWNPWRRKTTRSRRSTGKRPCGASCIARRADVLISTSQKTMNTVMD